MKNKLEDKDVTMYHRLDDERSKKIRINKTETEEVDLIKTESYIAHDKILHILAHILK